MGKGLCSPNCTLKCTYKYALLLTDSNFTWKSGREHDCLSLPHWGHVALLNDSPNLRLKPHVQHPVSLIQNHIPTRWSTCAHGSTKFYFTLYILTSRIHVHVCIYICKKLRTQARLKSTTRMIHTCTYMCTMYIDMYMWRRPSLVLLPLVRRMFRGNEVAH